jgi:hypothetical protein
VKVYNFDCYRGPANIRNWNKESGRLRENDFI